MAKTKEWRPSSWELQCLQQLDDQKIWASLRKPKPDPLSPLPRSVVALIFRFNFVIFLAVIGLIVFGGMLTLGGGLAELNDPWNLAFCVVVVLGLSGSMALFAAGIYRRSWNRRAEFGEDPLD